MSDILEERNPTSLTYDAWEEQFHPVINHINPDASFDNGTGNGGTLFETYGAEQDFVRTHDEHHVWTYLEAGAATCIVNGWVYANRIGYFVTATPWRKDFEIWVAINY
jgi:hypothetical protein